MQGAIRSGDSELERKLEKLEDLRRQTNKITQDVEQLSTLSATLLTVRGECLKTATRFTDNAGSIGDAADTLEKGTKIVLAYPMIEAKGGICMRQMIVNPDTAVVSWKWVKLHEKAYAEGSYVEDITYVGNFSVY